MPDLLFWKADLETVLELHLIRLANGEDGGGTGKPKRKRKAADRNGPAALLSATCLGFGSSSAAVRMSLP